MIDANIPDTRSVQPERAAKRLGVSRRRSARRRRRRRRLGGRPGLFNRISRGRTSVANPRRRLAPSCSPPIIVAIYSGNPVRVFGPFSRLSISRETAIICGFPSHFRWPASLCSRSFPLEKNTVDKPASSCT